MRVPSYGTATMPYFEPLGPHNPSRSLERNLSGDRPRTLLTSFAYIKNVVCGDESDEAIKLMARKTARIERCGERVKLSGNDREANTPAPGYQHTSKSSKYGSEARAKAFGNVK